MTLDAAHRSSIYNKLVPLLGEDDANVLMSEFPSVEAEELVTKDHLRAELLAVRGDLADLAADLRGEMADLASGLRGEMADLASGLRSEMAELRSGMASLETRLTIRIGAAFGASTAILATLNLVG